jgi:aminopeptidase YwaD
VVVGAHYDHLGRGGFGSLSPKSHEIHSGADDNASGTAALIELARELAIANDNGQKLPRSVIFIAFTAEEEGLIGSQHFVNHPPVPLAKMAAMLNLDMVGRVRNETLFVGGGGTSKSFEKMLEEADAGSPLKLKDIGKGGMGPSDHMAFAMKKVPVIFFFSGLHADYHRPTDKIEKINFNGMAEVVDLSKRLVTEMAQMPLGGYVDAADAHSMSAGMGSGSGGGSRVALGVVPDYSADESASKGVKISGTTPGTPAAGAGLQSGDVLVGFNDKKLESLMDLSHALAASKPGDKVKLRVMRDAKELMMDVTLVERK